MWYVIQTMSGNEHEVCLWINTYIDKSFYKRCFVPLYQDVWRQGGIAHSEIKRLFPGYLFIETDTPERVYEALKKILKFAVVLSADDDSSKCFLPLHKEEEIFFDTILSDGLMTISYIHKNKSGRIDMVIGPLQAYMNKIETIDPQHRRAMVNIPLLGKKRRIKFGLWLDKDPEVDWIEAEKAKLINTPSRNQDRRPDDQWDWEEWKKINEEKKSRIIDEGISDFKVGDYVINTTGIYGDIPLEVVEVLPDKNSVKVSVIMFDRKTSVEMEMDKIVKIGDAS